MALYLQSIRSGSSGNCVALWTKRTKLLIDAGFRSMRGCRDAFEHILPDADEVVVSHLHGDHVHYSALRVLEERGIPVRVYEDDLSSLRGRHFRSRSFDGLELRTFDGRAFRVGDFTVEPFTVPHYPGLPTFGFAVTCTQRGRCRKVVVATDLAHERGVVDHFTDADFIYIEANHDPDLLLTNPNPNSFYHLSNAQCGDLLRHALDRSSARPAAIMLGHLSHERNEPALAHDTVGEILDAAGHGDIALHVAPRNEPSAPIRIGG